MKKLWLLYILAGLFFFTACSDDDPVTPPGESNAEGIFILSEGGQALNNAALSYSSFDYANQTKYCYRDANSDERLGALGNNMDVWSDSLYILCSSSNLLQIVNAQNFNKLIIGTWELERYDNISPKDAPPGGLRNLTYIFYDNNKFKFFLPGYEDNFQYGRDNTPYKEYIPYKIKGNSFWGWLGLVNDLHGKRTINFLNKNQFTIEYSDSSIATFRRLSKSIS
ncbi:MAG: hypothetical protein ACEPO8_15565, partial [Rhodothermaceae bacterium]